MTKRPDVTKHRLNVTIFWGLIVGATLSAFIGAWCIGTALLA